jgi:hypothetical protein
MILGVLRIGTVNHDPRGVLRTGTVNHDPCES